MSRRAKDCTGMRWGRRFVISRVPDPHRSKEGYVCWVVGCECGSTPVVMTSRAIGLYRTGSCGCASVDRMTKFMRTDRGREIQGIGARAGRAALDQQTAINNHIQATMPRVKAVTT